MEITFKAVVRCEHKGCFRSAEYSEGPPPDGRTLMEFDIVAFARFALDGWKIDKHGCKCPDHN